MNILTSQGDLVPGAPLLDDPLLFQLGYIHRGGQLSGPFDLLFSAGDVGHGCLPAGRLIAPRLLGLAQGWRTAGVYTRGRGEPAPCHMRRRERPETRRIKAPVAGALRARPE